MDPFGGIFILGITKSIRYVLNVIYVSYWLFLNLARKNMIFSNIWLLSLSLSDQTQNPYW